jgi:PTS system nitrogen regulatory IIA component
MTVSDLLAEERILPDLVSVTKADVLVELSELMESSVPGSDSQAILGVIREREELNSTAIGSGVALPHGRLPGLDRVLAGFARSRAGVDFDSADGDSTHLFFILLAPDDSAAMHLKALAGISRLLKDEGFRSTLLATPADEILTLIQAQGGEANP